MPTELVANRSLESLPTFEARMLERDARELHTREVNKQNISRTAENKREEAQRAEDTRIDAYERDKKLLKQAHASVQAVPSASDPPLVTGTV